MLGSAVHPQPFPAIEVVDRVEPARIGKQAETHDPDQDSQDEIDDLPPATNLVVGRDPDFDPTP